MGQGAAGYLGVMKSKPPAPSLPMGLQAAWHKLPMACPPSAPGNILPYFPHLTELIVGVCPAWPMLPATSSELGSRELGGVRQINKEFRG